MAKIELLAPAGDAECLRAALHFGADAVYAGGPGMHLRAGAPNFTLDTLADAIAYTHSLGRRLYVTVNALAHNRDMEEMPGYLASLRDMAADAVIVSDMGVFSLCRRLFPELPVHISTQASCINYESAAFYHRLGAGRVVLGREMSLEEIAQLRARTDPALELEAFVHGAMCMAYSGRCLLSNYLAGREGNGGACAQPCRWQYALVEEKRPGQYYPLYEDEKGSAILSAYDLNALPLLPRLLEAGVSSLKIEGRMKTPYYVATVTGAYRKALDGTGDTASLLRELDSISHRAYCTGFYEGPIPAGNPAGYLQGCRFAAVVTGAGPGWIQVEQRGRFRQGDRLEVLSPVSLGLSFPAQDMTDLEGAPVPDAKRVQQTLRMPCPYPLQPGDMLRVRVTEEALD